MISSIAYAIILMGCSDDMNMCSELARDKRVFSTLRDCERAQEESLMSDVALKIDYPVVAARCESGGKRFAKTGAAYIGQ